ncbi:MAG: metal-dependent transcriptional regulator [Clostridia bacterium]|nr:metal-dependent transcriptional regulator [Clostridia bacterium]
MIKNELNSSKEDYLETILILRNKKGSCLSIDVANYLGFSKPSVSAAVKKLESQYLITRDNNGELFLTDSGKEIAEKIYERHIILTRVLKDIGVSDEVAENDACGIEHILSDEAFSCLKKHIDGK